jgi:hypothetical protein
MIQLRVLAVAPEPRLCAGHDTRPTLTSKRPAHKADIWCEGDDEYFAVPVLVSWSRSLPIL